MTERLDHTHTCPACSRGCDMVGGMANMDSPFRTITFEWTQLAAQARLPAQLQHATIIDVQRQVLGDLVYRLQCIVPSLPLAPQCISYPLNWVEAIKQRFAPQWLLDRWPLRYRTHIITGTDLYPDCREAIEAKMGQPYRMVVIDDRSSGVYRPLRQEPTRD